MANMSKTPGLERKEYTTFTLRALQQSFDRMNAKMVNTNKEDGKARFHNGNIVTKSTTRNSKCYRDINWGDVGDFEEEGNRIPIGGRYGNKRNRNERLYRD